MKVASSLDSLIGETPLVDISNLVDKKDVNIYEKLEGLIPTGSIKDRIAKYMIDTAEKNGTIKPGQTILEPTSGNTGIALALQARMRGYKLKVVIPESVSQERFELLKSYGAEIIYSTRELGSNGALALSKELIEKNTD